MKKILSQLNLLFLVLIGHLFFTVPASFGYQLPPKAELEKGPLEVSQAFRVTAENFDSSDSNISNKGVTFNFEIARYYYLYQEKIYLSIEQDQQSQPEVKKITPALVGSEIAIDDEFFGRMVIYKNQLKALFDLSSHNLRSNENIFLNYQGCWEGGVCYPPQKMRLDRQNLTFNSSSQINNFSLASLSESYDNQNYVANLLDGASLWLLIVIFLLIGFLLAFTPCVLPTFPLVYSVIIQKNKSHHPKSKLRNFYLALSFVLASALTYAAIGLIAGIFGEKIQFLLQKQWITLLAIALMLALAGSMFGFYQIQFPRQWQNKANEMASQSGVSYYFGASMMGIFSALIIGPCLAPPLAGILIFLTDFGSAKIGAIALFSLGIGMGLPLLLLTSSLSHLFQKRGMFMQNIERIFGFLILLVAVYLADRLISDRITLLLYGIILIFLANYLRVMIQFIQLKLIRLILWLGMIICLVIGVLEVIGFFVNARYATDPLGPLLKPEAYQAIEKSDANKRVVRSVNQLENQLNQAKTAEKIAIIKFSANWCITCKTIDQEIFENQNIITELDNHYLIEADVSEINQQSYDLLDYFNLIGPPAIYFFHPRDGLNENLTMIGVVERADFLNNLNIMIER